MNEQWVEHLLTTYSKQLLQYLFVHTGCREDAEDILQEVFASCYKARESFDPEKCNEQAWLFILARNRLKNYYRDRKVHSSLEDMDMEPSDYVDVNEEAVQLMECREMIAKALEYLDERSRIVVVLRFFENRSCRDIAEGLGITEGNVRVIQNRALHQMEKFLKRNHYILE